MTSRLNPEDQRRVDEYLSAPQHQVERRPFRPLLLLLLVVAVTIGLGLLSRLLSGTGVVHRPASVEGAAAVVAA
ncbi:MAG: DUF3094 family protein, partial [Pseudomonas sp.]|nr:DUF3094 family protein [Pseudomonas sp.]